MKKKMITETEVFTKIKEICVEQLGCEPSDVEMKTNFHDELGADSLDDVELVMKLEKEFQIEINDEDNIRTVEDAVKIVCSKAK